MITLRSISTEEGLEQQCNILNTYSMQLAIGMVGFLLEHSFELPNKFGNSGVYTENNGTLTFVIDDLWPEEMIIPFVNGEIYYSSLPTTVRLSSNKQFESFNYEESSKYKPSEGELLECIVNFQNPNKYKLLTDVYPAIKNIGNQCAIHLKNFYEKAIKTEFEDIRTLITQIRDYNAHTIIDSEFTKTLFEIYGLDNNIVEDVYKRITDNAIEKLQNLSKGSYLRYLKNTVDIVDEFSLTIKSRINYDTKYNNICDIDGQRINTLNNGVIMTTKFQIKILIKGLLKEILLLIGIKRKSQKIDYNLLAIVLLLIITLISDTEIRAKNIYVKSHKLLMLIMSNLLTSAKNQRFASLCVDIVMCLTLYLLGNTKDDELNMYAYIHVLSCSCIDSNDMDVTQNGVVCRSQGLMLTATQFIYADIVKELCNTRKESLTRYTVWELNAFAYAYTMNLISINFALGALCDSTCRCQDRLMGHQIEAVQKQLKKEGLLELHSTNCYQLVGYDNSAIAISHIQGQNWLLSSQCQKRLVTIFKHIDNDVTQKVWLDIVQEEQFNAAKCAQQYHGKVIIVDTILLKTRTNIGIILGLAASEWITRGWTFQESAKAKELYVYCDNGLVNIHMIGKETNMSDAYWLPGVKDIWRSVLRNISAENISPFLAYTKLSERKWRYIDDIAKCIWQWDNLEVKDLTQLAILNRDWFKQHLIASINPMPLLNDSWKPIQLLNLYSFAISEDFNIIGNNTFGLIIFGAIIHDIEIIKAWMGKWTNTNLEEIAFLTESTNVWWIVRTRGGEYLYIQPLVHKGNNRYYRNKGTVDVSTNKITDEQFKIHMTEFYLG